MHYCLKTLALQVLKQQAAYWTNRESVCLLISLGTASLQALGRPEPGGELSKL